MINRTLPEARAARGSAVGPKGRRDQRGPSANHLRRRAHVALHTLFAERLVAVLSGERPVHWMLGHTVGEAYEQLVQLASGAPLGGHGVRPVVRRCRGFQPCTGVVEAFASIAVGERVSALAFRLEQGRDLRWRCAAVEIGGACVGALSE